MSDGEGRGGGGLVQLRVTLHIRRIDDPDGYVSCMQCDIGELCFVILRRDLFGGDQGY